MAVIKRLAIFGYLVFLLFFVVAISQYWVFYHRPIVTNQAVTFKIMPGQSVREVLFNLSAHDQIKPFSPLWFEFFIRAKGASAHVQAGEYQLNPGTSGDAFLNLVLEGDVVQYAHTIVEGWTLWELLESLGKNPDLVQTIEAGQIQSLPQMLKTDHALEGWFFPETYFFPKGTTDLQFLKRAKHMMEAKLQLAWSYRDPNIVLKTPYEALIMASIIEKESHLAGEWPYVSQVFHNRLIKGMRLQADPTVIYGLGVDFDGDIKKSDLKMPTPYNSYLNKGLPPTPIAMPGFGALLAAVRPAAGDYLYFVAKGDGTHHFSNNLKEHEKMVNQYIKGQS